MWDEALDWLLFLLMVSYLICCEPFISKPLCQPCHLYYRALLMEFYPIIPWEMFYPKDFCCQQWLPDPNIVIVLIHDNDWHYITFWLGKATVNRNSLQQIMYSSHIYLARNANGYFGVLAQSAWNGSELLGTHIGWLVYPIQT